MSQSVTKYWVSILLGIVLCLPVMHAWSKDNKYWNFNNVDIKTLVQQIADETGKNFVLDPRVQGEVTVISSKALEPKDAYQVFLSVLRIHGYAAIENDQLVKIVPFDKAKTQGAKPILKPLNRDDLVIKVIDLKYLDSRTMYTQLKQLVDKSSYMASFDQTNHLVIADTASNIFRIEAVIAQLDTPKSMMVDMVPVQHASALDLADTLNKIVSTQSNRKGGSAIHVSADERTNSLLISGGTPELRAYTHTLIEKLDASVDNLYNSEVIYLKYAKAPDLAPIVASFLEDAMRSSEKPEDRRQAGQSGGSSKSPTRFEPTSFPEAPSNHLRALRDPSATSNTQGSLFETNESQPQSGVLNRFVQWEESTNALIVKAPPNLMRAVKSIISKLDIRRPQVMIEVIIAEVTLDRATELGVEWNTSPRARVDFGTRFINNSTNTLNGLVSDFNPGTLSQLGTGLSVGIFRHGNLRILAKALAADNAANILSTPTLVTLDNQTALIKVGELVPFAIGQTDNSNTGGNPFTSFEREEVGLSLTIRPQITPSGSIKLEIENILSNIISGSNTQNAGNNPRTSERTIVTNVMIDDGKILVLGGLIQDSWQEIMSEVPLLGRIPLVGDFFRKTDKQLVKRNLMVFIKPVIMRDEIQGIAASTRKYNFMRESQKRSHRVLNRPLVDEPIVVPPLESEDYYPKHHAGIREDDLYPGLVLPTPFAEP